MAWMDEVELRVKDCAEGGGDQRAFRTPTFEFESL